MNNKGKRGVCSIVWTADDIKGLRPKWSKRKCQDWLEENARRIEDRSIELGWEVIECLLDD